MNVPLEKTLYGLGQWSENVVTLVQLHYTS
jgi:hypothetical protein